jgi:hypothetical protein
MTPGFAAPTGPWILMVPGPTKKSLNLFVSDPSDKTLDVVGIMLADRSIVSALATTIAFE